MGKSWVRAALAAVVGWSALAYGQASPQAEALFRDGKQLMKQGKLAEACAAFEGSEHAEHNIATVLSLADCREKNGQYASAWALFLQAESQTRTDPKQAMLNTTAKTRELQLEPRMSYLTINVPDESRIPELVVTRDGVPVDPAEWNRAIPADGGTHEIAGKAPGHEPWSTKVTIGPEHDKQAVEVPKFKALPQIVGKPLGASAAPPAPSPFTTRRIVALSVAGTGVLVAGASIYLGLDARSLHSDALATCPPAACTPAGAADAQNQNDRARSRALYANIGFGVSAAALATGVVLWMIGAPESPVAITPMVGPETGEGAAIVGRF